MNSEAILAIGGVVGSLSKFVQMSGVLVGWKMSLAAGFITTAVFWVWGYSHGDFARETTWDYFMAWVTTLSVAAGAFHGTEQAVKKANDMGDR